MGEQQFTQPVGGSGGQPVSTNATGTMETDNYPSGGSFDESAFPVTVNPPETIQELVFTVVTGAVDIEITTTGDDTFTIPLQSPAAFDKWEIDSVTFKNGGTNRIAGGWAGDAQ